MSYLPPAAHRLFARQHGAVSLDQLLGTGLTVKQIENHVSNGSLISVLRGAYRSPSASESEALRCAEICLARPEVVIAGSSPSLAQQWTSPDSSPAPTLVPWSSKQCTTVDTMLPR